jgi:uncharacterized protein YndB with AHSA1/START domain
MTTLDSEIRKRVIVPAPIEQVWGVWTTVEGITSFFAPAARLEFRIGGAFEMLFLLDAEPGEQGSEGCHVLRGSGAAGAEVHDWPHRLEPTVVVIDIFCDEVELA